MGRQLGCATDQEAVFYAVNAPAVHTISGLGATFVFGHDAVRDTDGRLIVTNAGGSTRFRFNQRYVAAEDIGGQPSFGVSIVSVNGKAISGPDANGGRARCARRAGREPSAGLGGRYRGRRPPADARGSVPAPTLDVDPQPRRPSPPRWDPSQPLIPLRTGGVAPMGRCVSAGRSRNVSEVCGSTNTWSQPRRVAGVACRWVVHSSAW